MPWNLDTHGGRTQLDELARGRRSPSQTTVTEALPRSLSRGEKAPEFLRAGAEILMSYAELDDEAKSAYSWLEQSEHLAPDIDAPHTYIYRSRAPRLNAGPKMLMLASQGPPNPCWADGELKLDAIIVTATTITDKYGDPATGKVSHGTMRRGKCFRLARITRDGTIDRLRDLSSADFECMHDFQLVHVGLNGKLPVVQPALVLAPPAPPMNHILGNLFEDPMDAHERDISALALGLPAPEAADSDERGVQLEAELEKLWHEPDEAMEARTRELELCVYDDHEPRIQTLERRMTAAGLPPADQAGHQRAGSSGTDAGNEPVSAIKTRLMVLLQRSTHPKDKLQLRRELIAELADDGHGGREEVEIHVKDINKALYELQREGRACKATSDQHAGNDQKPLWQVMRQAGTSGPSPRTH